MTVFLAQDIPGFSFQGMKASKVHVTVSWCSDHPVHVLLTIDDGHPEPPVWRIARNLLARGLSSPRWVGDGDVTFRAPGSFLTMHLHPPEADTYVVLRREGLDQLVDDAERIVPDQSDHESQIVMAALDRELARIAS